MAGRVTIQDIADALGVSRNTVSKAINNTGTIADATRDKILQKAVAMGYKQFSYVSVTNGTNVTAQLTTSALTGSGNQNIAQSPSEFPIDPQKNVISLLTASFLGSSHFSSTMLDKFQRELSYYGYSLTMHRVNDEDIQNRTLPLSFNKETTAGIICFEIFDMQYSEMLCDQDIPILFVDAPSAAYGTKLKSDLLIMDNRTNIISLINELAKRGMKKFGFIGNPHHCLSFFERYMGFKEALLMAGIPYDDKYSFLDSCIDNHTDQISFHQYLYENLKELKELPDAFLCANDFVAIDTLQIMAKLGISVPDDVCLCGFDDSPESRIIAPPLTTIHIHSQIMGISAVHLLTTRIKQPSMNFRTIYTETSLIYRKSTKD